MRRSWTSLLLVLLACGSDSSTFGNGGPSSGDGSDGGGPDNGGAGPGGGVHNPGDGTTGGQADAGDCSHELLAIVRDFRPCVAEPNETSCRQSDGHLDFEHYRGDDVAKGIVRATLGDDDKPVWIARGTTNEGFATTDAAHFLDWYRTAKDVNIALERRLPLIKQADGHYVYERTEFFPIDDDKGVTTGWGNGPRPPAPNQNIDHNFEFTTEVHLSFTYRGGEVFKFHGDDDLWVFIDRKLVIDLGGTHPPKDGQVDLNTLQLTVGKAYAMDLFHAERHTEKSNFRVDTTIECFEPPIVK